jgi:copper homeostasis protein (lipoprotein)
MTASVAWGAARPAPEPALGALPATFAGLLPCADCVGIRCQINLLREGAYVQRMTYLRDGRDESRYELGRWSLSEDGRTLTLEGGKENTAWAVEDARTLRKLGRDGRPIASRLPSELTRRPGVEPLEPRLRLTGMFRYGADAARFRDCRSRLEWPVTMSDDYQALERAYSGQRAAPGADLMVILDGRIEPRPRMEGAGTEPTLVVERFIRAAPGERCPEPAVVAGLENTRWRPLRIAGREVTLAGRGEPWIELDPLAERVTGSGGCNRIAGGYQTGPGTLRFGRIISTRMACPEMEGETAFLRALADTRRYRIRGRMLELLDDRGRLLAELEERSL